MKDKRKVESNCFIHPLALSWFMILLSTILTRFHQSPTKKHSTAIICN
jgi:hypothetical protein